MPDREKVKTGIFEMLQRDTWKDIDPERSRFQPVLNDALELLREQQAEIERLKQEKLVDVDKLREKLGFAESCEKCKKDSWQCQQDMYFSEMDFCTRLDIAIEELIQEGR